MLEMAKVTGAEMSGLGQEPSLWASSIHSKSLALGEMCFNIWSHSTEALPSGLGPEFLLCSILDKDDLPLVPNS